MLTLMSCTGSSVAGSAHLLLFDSSPAPLWPPHLLRAHFPLFARPSTLSITASPFKNNAAAGLNVPEGVTMVMETGDSDEFVEVGVIRGTHGVKGELKVMSLTDFPEQRFERPGIRWVGFYRTGKLVGLRKIKLLSGRRITQGKESAWLLTIEGIDSKEQASELLGATILIEDADKPVLDADQFYIPDLIGMSVQMKDSGKLIGSIVDIFNSGASDLLRVKLSDAEENDDGRDDKTNNHLIWIPFVKEIVPVVDKENRLVRITPPQGLLELNLPSKKPLKQDMRKQALRSKRKLQERMSGIRKKLSSLKQDHILSGIAHGDVSQREALKMQLLGIDFTAFKRAIETASANFKVSLDSDAYVFNSAIAPSLDWKGLRRWLEAAPKEVECSDEVCGSTSRSWRRGLGLVAEGRVAIVALATGDLTDADGTDSSLESSLEDQAGQLLAMQELAEMISGAKPLIPWVVVTTEASSEYIENLFKDESHFGLSKQQVHFVKLSSLPVVSPDGEGVQKIMMESQWRIIAAAAGDGHVIGDLEDSGVLNDLMERGIDYVHLCSMDKASINMDPAIFGVMDEQNACVGIKVTSEPFEGDHGVLCLQKVSVDPRSRSIFIPALEKAAGSVKSITDTFEHFSVLKPYDVPKAGSLDRIDNALTYRVPLSCNYTLSAEYLRHLSLQRHDFIYEGEQLKETVFKQISGESGLGTETCQDDAVQLKCSLHNALMFCSPSRVALFNYDMFHTS